MLIRAKGGIDGIVEYLQYGQMKDRFYSRDELDKRVVLFGNLDMVDNAIHSYKNDGGEKYFHITLAFKEEQINEDILVNIAKEFREFYFKAYKDDEISFYAEAHLPKIKSYRDNKTGELVERKPHIHVVVPKINLLTGGSLDTKEKFNIKYVNAFQEYVNNKYGLASPKDNKRYNFTDKSEIISRYKGDVFSGLDKEIKEKILDLILTKNPTNYKELMNLLDQDGFVVKVRNLGKNDEYLNVKLPDSKKGTNLKDNVFRKSFLSLSLENKLEYLDGITNTHNLSREEQISIIERAKFGNDYVEVSKLIRPFPQEYSDLLDEWNNFVCYRRKYIDRMCGSAEREHFKALSNDAQKVFISQKKEEFYLKYRGVNSNEFGQSEQEQLGDIYRRVAFNNLQSAEGNNGELIKNVERSRRHTISPITYQRRRAIRNEYARLIGVSEGRYDDNQVGSEFNKEQNRRRSTVDSITNDYINKELVTGAFKPEFDYFKKTLRADVLLEMLEKSNGVIPEKYRITIAKDGTDRIGCGVRNYNVVDFCLKELHLDWVNTVKILRASELMQATVDREQGWNLHKSQYLREEYVKWLNEYKKAKDIELATLTAEVKERWNEIKLRFENKVEDIKKSDVGYHKKAELRRLLKMDRLVENRALYTGRNKDLLAIREKYNLSMQESYRKFLIEKSELGDDVALLELKRLRIDFEEYETTGTIKYVDRYEDFRLNVTHRIDKNGCIVYYLENEQIIKDSGKRVDILRDDANNLKLALDLAISKFGMSLELHGTEKFRQKLVELSIKGNYKIRFKDSFSENYRLKLLLEYKEAHERQEQKNKAVLETLKTIKRDLLVIDSYIVNAVDDNGKFKEATTIKLVDLNTNEEFEVSGPLIKKLLGNESLSVGNIVTLSSEDDKIKIDPYYWSKFTNDIKRGITIKEFLSDDKIKIEMPTLIQSKYENNDFIIECADLSNKLMAIGYQDGDVLSIETTIDKDLKKINYNFVILGESKEKLLVKEEILNEDIKMVQNQFYVNNASEISGTVIDCKVRFNIETQKKVGIIAVSNDTVCVHENVISIKNKLCRENNIKIYDLEKEVAGKITNICWVDYNNKDVFCLSIETNYGLKKLYGQSVYDVALKQGFVVGDYVYIAHAGVQSSKQIDGSISISNNFKYKNYVGAKLEDNCIEYIDDFMKSKYTKYKKEEYIDLISSKNIKIGENYSILKDGVVDKNVVVHKNEIVVAPFNIELFNNDMEMVQQKFDNKYPGNIFRNYGAVALGEIQDFSKEITYEVIKVAYKALITPSGNRINLYGNDTQFADIAIKRLGARLIEDGSVEQEISHHTEKKIKIYNYDTDNIESISANEFMLNNNITDIAGKVVFTKQIDVDTNGENKYEVFDMEETNKYVTEIRNGILKEKGLESAGFKGIIGQIIEYNTDENGKPYVDIAPLDGTPIRYSSDSIYALEGYDEGEYVYLTEVSFEENMTRQIDSYKAYKPKDLVKKVDLQNSLSKEVCGKVVDFGTGYRNKESSYYIVIEDKKYKIKPEALEIKQDFCRKNGISLYELEKENCGKILSYGKAKFDETKEGGVFSYFIELETAFGKKRIWGFDLARLVEEHSLEVNEYVYFAQIGYIKMKSPNDKHEKTMNKFECIKLNKEQLKYKKDLTKLLYTRYWNKGFGDLIKNGKVIKNEHVYLAKVGEIKNKCLDKLTKAEKELVTDKFDIATIGADIERRAVLRLRNNRHNNEFIKE